MSNKQWWCFDLLNSGGFSFWSIFYGSSFFFWKIFVVIIHLEKNVFLTWIIYIMFCKVYFFSLLKFLNGEWKYNKRRNKLNTEDVISLNYLVSSIKRIALFNAPHLELCWFCCFTHIRISSIPLSGPMIYNNKKIAIFKSD